MMEFLTPIIINLTRIVISAFVTYLCVAIIPRFVTILKQIGLYRVVKFFVAAAEKMADTKRIPKETKKQWVKDILAKVGIQDNEIIDALIEGAVEELDNQKGKIDRKSTRLNSSHVAISYAVFCLKKKKNKYTRHSRTNI